jgi:hypothetical protein
MHEAPYWSSRRLSRMARTAGCTVLVLAAGIAAGVATATEEPGTRSYGPSKLQQPGVGPVMVGLSVGLLVFVALRIAYVVRERPRKPNKKYRTKYERGLTFQQYLRRLWSLMLVVTALCCLGLWLRHQYG